MKTKRSLSNPYSLLGVLLTLFPRWYLVHWMIYHGLAMFGLFTISILVFVIQTHLLKLIGLAPLAVVVMLAIIWIQVNKEQVLRSSFKHA